MVGQEETHTCENFQKSVLYMKFINLGSETSLDQDCGVEALCQVEEQKQFPEQVVNFLLCITLTMDQPWVNY